MKTLECPSTLDRALFRRAERKCRRYGTDVNGILSVLVSIRGMPEQLRPVPSVIEFDVHGRHFVADITPDGGRYCAVVRGHPDCFTEGGSEAELRKYLAEVAELVLFDKPDAVYP